MNVMSKPMSFKSYAITAVPTRFFSGEYESTFKDRAAGKAQLKEFYKFTHPDFFGNAPEQIKNTNETNMQTLNAYLQSTQTLNQTVPDATLAFFVRKDKLLQ